MEDLKLLISEWVTINALALLINDGGYGKRNKLTLLAAVQFVCWERVDGDRQSQRGRQV